VSGTNGVSLKTRYFGNWRPVTSWRLTGITVSVSNGANTLCGTLSASEGVELVARWQEARVERQMI